MSKVMNKSDLVDAIATASDISKASAARAVDAFVGFIVNSVSKDARVSLIGFGTFERSKRAARKGRNPQTGAIIDIPAAKLPRFKAGKAFKDAVNIDN
jgi:DNA-binding protein HU-beta